MNTLSLSDPGTSKERAVANDADPRYRPPVPAPEPLPWRPKPAVAALLNVTAGLGHVYSGRPIEGIVVFVGAMVLCPMLWNLSALAGTPALRLEIAGLVFAVNLIVLPTLGYLAARKAATAAAVDKRWFQRWPELLLYAIVAWLVAPRALHAIAPATLTSFRVSGESMRPTLYPDDVVKATPIGTPQRGDVIVVRRPDGATWVRRIIAMPGDVVELRNFHAFVNGQPETPRLGPCTQPDDPNIWSEPARRSANFGPVTVPAGEYALFGDCRDNARDVRTLGFTPAAQIWKRVSWILWSRVGTDGREGFDRVGTRVR